MASTGPGEWHAPFRLGAKLDHACEREKAAINSKAWGDAYEATFNVMSAIVAQVEKQQPHTLEGLRVGVHRFTRLVAWGKNRQHSLEIDPVHNIIQPRFNLSNHIGETLRRTPEQSTVDWCP